MAAATKARATLHRAVPALPITVLSPPALGDPLTLSRLTKLNLDTLSPYRYTLYLDADTEVLQPAIMVGAEILQDGCDLVITPSQNQGNDFLAHSTPEDAQATRAALGDLMPLQLQAGVFWVSWNERTRALWQAWRAEYGQYGQQDQGALLRALEVAPVKIWLLGAAFNSKRGSIVKHNFGRAR